MLRELTDIDGAREYEAFEVELIALRGLGAEPSWVAMVERMQSDAERACYAEND